jgi:septum formation protein
VELILASQSPRRRELLAAIGLEFRVHAADVDESWLDDEDPRAYVERVALAKVEQVAHELDRDGGVCVLAADTTVDLDGRIFAKPADDADARRMLSALSGRTHEVHTAVVGWTIGGIFADVVTTRVAFAPLSHDDVEWYLSFGEHRDKAGAYGMQSAGGALVDRIDGSPSNVIGLPLAETISVLHRCGVDVFGRPAD